MPLPNLPARTSIEIAAAGGVGTFASGRRLTAALTVRSRKRLECRKGSDVSWQDRAACRGMDVRLFFGPDGEQRPERESREAEAKAVCASCPVQAQCLDYALGKSIKHGIWGGLNEGERARERRRRARRREAA